MNNAVKIPVTEGLQPSSEVTEMKYQAFLDAVVKKLKKNILMLISVQMV